jgi:hypothetical protein
MNVTHARRNFKSDWDPFHDLATDTNSETKGVAFREHFYKLDNCWELPDKTKLSPLLLKSSYRLSAEDLLFENAHTV